MGAVNNSQLPCGACDCGVYAEECLANGDEFFKNHTSRKQALKDAPRCKHEPDKICMGARDYILYEKFRGEK